MADWQSPAGAGSPPDPRTDPRRSRIVLQFREPSAGGGGGGARRVNDTSARAEARPGFGLQRAFVLRRFDQVSISVKNVKISNKNQHVSQKMTIVSICIYI